MAMDAKKTKYLTYIEDTRIHHKKIGDAAKKSAENAILNSQENEIPVTFLEGVEIVQIASNGQIITIGKVENNRRQVQIGGKARIPKS
jgi:hypothetical protein